MKNLFLDITFNSKDNIELTTSAGYGFIRIESKTKKNKEKLVRCEYTKFDPTISRWVYHQPFAFTKEERQEVVKVMLNSNTIITNMAKLLAVSESTINRDIKTIKAALVVKKK